MSEVIEGKQGKDVSRLQAWEASGRGLSRVEPMLAADKADCDRIGNPQRDRLGALSMLRQVAWARPGI